MRATALALVLSAWLAPVWVNAQPLPTPPIPPANPPPPPVTIGVAQPAPDHVDIYFQPNSDQVGPDQAATLARLAALYARFHPKTMVLTGHADPSGDPLGNTYLSLARARTVLRTLRGAADLPKTGWIVAGAGANEPVGDDDSSNRSVRVTWK